MKTISLKQYLKKKNIKPSVFAVHIGVTERSVYSYMDGKFPNRRIEALIKTLTDGKVEVGKS